MNRREDVEGRRGKTYGSCHRRAKHSLRPTMTLTIGKARQHFMKEGMKSLSVMFIIMAYGSEKWLQKLNLLVQRNYNSTQVSELWAHTPFPHSPPAFFHLTEIQRGENLLAILSTDDRTMRGVEKTSGEVLQ